MSILLTPSLQKSLSKLQAPSSNDAGTALAITAFIHQKTNEFKTLISQFEANLEILELQKNRCADVIAILEEAGGLTIRARNYVSTPEDATKYRDKTQEMETLFKTALSKLDVYVPAATDNGINLLNGKTLETKFDEKGDKTLITHGISLDSNALGIRQPDFSTMPNVQNARIDVMNAIDMAVTLRNIISSDISAISTSLDFSKTTIENANLAIQSLGTTLITTESKNITDLANKKMEFDEPLAEPAQQDILNSFAATPNMEGI